MPPSYAWARQIARRVERARGSFAERPCHNDLLNANFIDDGRRIRIVDWEYAGMGDVFFDLANFSVNHGFGPDERAALLSAYVGDGAAGGSARARADAVHVATSARRCGPSSRVRSPSSSSISAVCGGAFRAHGGDRRHTGVRRCARRLARSLSGNARTPLPPPSPLQRRSRARSTSANEGRAACHDLSAERADGLRPRPARRRLCRPGPAAERSRQLRAVPHRLASWIRPST